MRNSSSKIVRFLFGLLIVATASAKCADLVPLGSNWKYILGTQEASVPANAWRSIIFNDSTWPVGVGPMGYDTGGTPGTAPIVTVLPDPRTAGNPVWNSAYFRKAFNVADPSRVTSVILTLYVDDGAVVWLNGNEVGRINVPDGDLPFNGAASVAEETRVFTSTNIAGLLVAGTNVVAVHAFNGPASSSDFIFEAVVNATLDEPPFVENVEPFPTSIVTALNFIDVTFNEGVTGVDAADLRINGSPATNVTAISPREYVFNFPQPATGVVSVAWAPNPGINDQDLPPDAFVPGASWNYTLDPNVISAPAVISEFLADNENGIRDEEGTRSDWIELYNPGTIDINLGGWFLTDTTNILAKWRIPSINLGANKYLLIWASEKNRTNSAAPLHTNFKLSKTAGSYLALVNPQTNIISAFTSYPAQVSDVSYGRDRVDPNLIGFFTTPTPAAQNSTSGAGFASEPVFSLAGGIYTNDVLTMNITAPGGTTIRYTFDGSEPTTNSTVYAGPITFSTNMMIKARGFQAGVFPSAVGARTFVMLDNSTRDFTSNIPILIISTAGRSIPANLIAGAARPRGTFVAVDTFRGQSSLQGKTDYQGLGQFEIVGQTSAGFVWNGVAKPPYRIELNDELGNDRSASLLGMPPEADWNLRSPFTDKCLINDFLGYELWEDMGHYSCRRRLVEMFVDTGGGKLSYPGDYLGVFVLFERIEIGKDRVDLDKLTPTMTTEPSITGGYIIKKDKDSAGDTSFSTSGGAGHSGHVLKFHDPKPSEISITQSNWIRNYVNRFEASMYAANWTNAIGTNHYSNYIDVDQFVDQHLHVEFTKNIDGYRLSSYYSKDRNGKLKPEPVWDWNLSFGNANYLRGGNTNGWYWNLESVDEGIPSSKHIWLRRLVYGLPVITTAAPYTDANGPGDPDFRQKITDRWAVLRTNVLNGDRLVARIDELANILTEPAARNYARYSGLLNSYTWPEPEGPPYDVDYTQPTYAAIISEMKKWTKGRYVWMDNQFLSAPTLSKNSGAVSSSFLLTVDAKQGAVYYTTNGTDPRLPGGGISPNAVLYTGPINIGANASVVARAYVNPTPLWTPWSAFAVGTYVLATPKLVITEIMYHPAPPALGSTNIDEDFEYIELKNVGATAMNVNGFTLSAGVDFTFPNRTVNAGERILIVKNRFAFTNRYGATLNSAVVGEYIGNLANDGDRLVLQGSLHEPILDFTYDDDWYPITDGFGFSLVIVDENAAASAWGTKTQWRPSGTLQGTPGQGDGAPPVIGQVVINEALTRNDVPPPSDTIELRNLTGSPVDISGWFLTDDFSIPKKFRIPSTTTIAPNGFITFDEAAFNVVAPGNIPFALGALGDDVYLFSGDIDGNLTGYFHGFNFGAARNGVSFGRHVISTGEEDFVAQTSTTLGGPNAGLVIGPLVITEIMYRPVDVLANGEFWNNSEDEFIELRNISGAPVNLFDSLRPTNTWKLDNAVEFKFPMNTTIAAGSYLVVVNFNPATDATQLAAFRARYGIGPEVTLVGPYQGSLDNQDANVVLYSPESPQPDGDIPYVLVDRVHYRDSAPWPVTADGYSHSLQRLVINAYGNDPTNWIASGPTPGGDFISGSAPAISMNPISQAAPVSTTVIFAGAATSSSTLTYQWSFNGLTINGATNNVLRLTNIQPSQAGQYRLVALNSFGSAVSSPATLTVIIAATITQQPISQVVTNGTNAVFSVTATTQNPPLSYQWYHNGVVIPLATESVLFLTNVQEEMDSGDYTAAVTDGLGTVFTAPATLTILLPPGLLQPIPPMRITAVAGENVTLSVRTRGTKPMFYRWQRVLTNGSSLIVANKLTNSNNDFLLINNLPAVFDGAFYRVTLTNLAHGAFNLVFTNAYITVLADSNGNGIPDIWESAYFGSPTGANRDEDSDGDGMSNWSEYIAGTNPIDAGSYLKVDWSGANAAALTFEAVSNRSYTVQFKDSLEAAAWNRLTDVSAHSTNWISVLNDPTAVTNRFYRIVTPKN